MANLFVRPSQIVTKLRAIHAQILAEKPTFPLFKILAATDAQLQEELGDSDSTEPETTTLYVANGISTGTTEVTTAYPESEITHGVTILWVIGTRDEQAQYSDELSTLIKEFVLLALHGWEWQEQQKPLIFDTESFFRVKGKALYIRQLDFSHTVTLNYCDVDDGLNLFDALDDFLLLQGSMDAKLTPQDDIAEIDAIVTLPGPA